MTQTVLFTDEDGWDVHFGTIVGFTEEAANSLPSDIGNGSYEVDKMHDDGYTIQMVMIRYEEDRTHYSRISPEIRITVNKDQIATI